MKDSNFYGIIANFISIFFLKFNQVIILIVFPKLQGSEELLNAKNVLMFIVIFQYLPRLVRIIPLYLEITRSAGIIAETAWIGAAFNLLLYMLASHVSPHILTISAEINVTL